MNRHAPRLLLVLAMLCALLAVTFILIRPHPEESGVIAERRIEPGPGATMTPAPVDMRVAAQPAIAAEPARSTPIVELFQAPARSIGKRIDPSSAEYLQAALGGKRPVGRIAEVNPRTFARLSALRVGEIVRIPLMDGDAVEGVVNLVQPGAESWVRVGGSLRGGREGTFSLASDGREVAGRILLKSEQLAYEFEKQKDGVIFLLEKRLGDVICSPLPRMLEPQRAPAAGPQLAPPLLNSRPTAVAQLYLDFDGETVTDPDWNGGNTIIASAYPLSAAEITTIFNRVKEDFWPFNINVTTDVTKYNGAAVKKRMRCIITSNDVAAPGAGGVAYLNSFSRAGAGFSSNIPCWVFNSTVVGISEAISHELGHTFGLSHDGRQLPTTGHEEYFTGHGSGTTSWCPIMGAGYTRNVVQWSKGEYQYANNQEDDLAIISSLTNGFGYLADDAGGTIATAASLAADIATGVVNQVGLVERTNDIDVYTFATTGGDTTIVAQPAAVSPDLDIALELLDSTGATISANNPTNALNATVTGTALTAGIYFVKVTSSGAPTPPVTGYTTYGSLGAYTLTGSVAGLALQPIITSSSTANGQLGSVFGYSINATGNPTTFGLTGTLPVGLIFSAVNGVISGTPQEVGEFIVTISAGNTAGTSTRVLTITIAPAAVTLPQAVDFEALPWTTGGTAPWAAQTSVTFDGADAAVSGNVGDGESSYIETTVTGPVDVEFQWKVSSEVDADYLSFTVDGVDAALPISGEVDWTLVSVPLAAGPHALRWTFAKNGSVSDGADGGWLDAVNFYSTVAPTITSPPTASATLGQAFSYQITATNVPRSFRVSGQLPPGVDWNGATGLISGTPGATGTFPVTLRATNNIGTGIRAFTITVGPSPISVGEALDNLTQTYVLSGNANWFPENTVTFDGTDALQSGPILGSQTSVVSTNILGPKTVNFYWKTESEPGGDRLTFFIDTVEQAHIDGFTDWLNASILVPAGNHTIRWVYAKDSNNSLGADAAWLDQLVVTDDLLPVITSPNAASAQVGAGFTYDITALNFPTSFSASGLPSGLALNPVTGRISGVPTVTGSFPVSVGATNAAGTGTKLVTIQVAPSAAAIGDAVDAPTLQWTTGGSTTWFAQGAVTHDGLDAARTSPLANAQSTFIQVVVQGPIAVSFYWKVESEQNHDFLRFAIDNIFQAQLSGDSGWVQRVHALGAGQHTLKWTYSKDASVAQLQDAAFLDQVTFSNVTTVPQITSPLAATAYVGRPFLYQITATNSPTSYSLSSLPAGLALHPSTGRITGNPTAVGLVNLTLSAINASGTGIATLALDVQAELSGTNAFANATALGGALVSDVGTNIFATAETNEPQHVGRAALASIWWTWTAPLTGEARIDTVGSNFDTLLSVYQGTALNALTVVAENDDGGSTVVSSAVRFKAVAGQTYVIAVDGLGGITGNVVLNIGYTGFGNYTGLFTDVNAVASPGLAVLKLTEKLGFSGTISLNGKKYSIHGAFNGESYVGTVARGRAQAPLRVAFHLDLDPGAEEITGTVSDPDAHVTYDLFARHAASASDLAANVVGSTFTLALEPDALAAALPGGVGYGAVTISKTGAVKLIGVLGDGTPLSAGAMMDIGGAWILYATPYRGGGVVAGEVSVDARGPFAPLSASVTWIKNAEAKPTAASFYPLGFSTSATLKGYRFAKPALNVPVFTLVGATNNLRVLFSGSDLAAPPATFTGTLDTRNKFTGGPTAFKLNFATTTGLFSGSFLDSGKARVLGGAVLQGTQNRGAGYFRGTVQTGTIELKPTVAP